MVDFIQNLIGNEYLATFIMSFVPLIELKGAIVFGHGAGLQFIAAFLVSFIGSSLVFIPIYFLLKPVLNLLKKIKWFNKFALNIEDYFEQKAQQALEGQKGKSKKTRSETYLKQLGVFIFVAIPLPMTGVWTGTAIAVFLGLKFKQVILPICLGNLVAGLIISALASICASVWSIEMMDYILYALLGIAVILFAIVVIRIITKKSQREGEN